MFRFDDKGFDAQSVNLESNNHVWSNCCVLPNCGLRPARACSLWWRCSDLLCIAAVFMPDPVGAMTFVLCRCHEREH